MSRSYRRPALTPIPDHRVFGDVVKYHTLNDLLLSLLNHLCLKDSLIALTFADEIEVCTLIVSIPLMPGFFLGIIDGDACTQVTFGAAFIHLKIFVDHRVVESFGDSVGTVSGLAV